MSYQSRLELAVDATTGERTLRRFSGELDKTERAGLRSTRATKAAAAGIAAMTAAAAAGAVSLAALTRAGMNNIDEQAKLARQMDASIGGLRGLQLAANDAGVSTGVLNSNIQTLSARLGEAIRGSGQAGEVLGRLGLNAAHIASLDVDERIAVIADRVQTLGLSGAETADLLRQLGIRNREMVNLLRQGGDPIRDATEEIEDYGLAISQIDASLVEAANDALGRTGLLMESLRNALAVELSPVILEVASMFNDAARDAGGFGEVVASATENSIQALGFVMDAVEGVRRTFLLAGQGAAVFALTVDRWMAQAEQSIRQQPLQALVDLVGGLKELPGVGRIIAGGPLDILSQTLLAQSQAGQRDVEILRGAVEEGWRDIRRTLEEPMPSSGLEAFMDRVAQRRADLAEMAESGQQDGVGALLGYSGSISADVDRATQGTRALEEELHRAGEAAELYGFIGDGRHMEEETYWDRWLDSASTAFSDFDQMAANTAQSFQRGFGDAFESMAFDSQSAGDAARSMFEGVARTAVNALGQMAGQWIAYQAVQLATGRSTEAAAMAGAATTGTAIASSYAPAAAMASLASFGANSAPAMAGISSTMALSQGLALAGMAHDGIDRVPSEGTWLLDKGERVMNRPQADKLDQYLGKQEKEGRKGKSAPIIHIHEAPPGTEAEASQNEDGEWVVNVVVGDLASGGDISRAFEATYGASRQGR